ncbi:MAG: biotin--[acetyl-CoA-carboxylase] ligase [Oscillospiraceae bacterium]|nr:biotin--[acetyl-CoA-carboxylase] ligase [Oscillospiraceae bacterium]
MNTKNTILALLEQNRGKPISGARIAEQLNISRNAVWKAINSLKEDGYAIESVSNRGYTLLTNNNILSAAGIVPYLTNKEHEANIHILKSVDSTNNAAKEMAIAGAAHGTVIIAETQTAGRGRYGRSFYSPPLGGLYMSIILRTKFLGLTDTTHITASAAVAVCRAIETVTGVAPKIKWVNDIFLDDKKICGILTEAVTDFESGSIDWIVIGMGINVTTNDFPDDVQNIATSIFAVGSNDDNATVRSRIAAELINIFLSPDSQIFDPKIYAEYKEKSMLIGRTVTVIGSDEPYEATAIDIDEQCRLIVRKSNNSITALSTGEVSVKLFN